MENIVIRREIEESDPVAKKLPIMRTLARLHECDAEALYGSVDASELDVRDILAGMLTEEEVEASPATGRSERYSLTLKGWREYMKVLGSLYELPE